MKGYLPRESWPKPHVALAMMLAGCSPIHEGGLAVWDQMSDSDQRWHMGEAADFFDVFLPDLNREE